MGLIMAEPGTSMDGTSQERWDRWALGIARKETGRQLENVAFPAINVALGNLLSPIHARLAALESELALLRALGPPAAPAKAKGKTK